MILRKNLKTPGREDNNEQQNEMEDEKTYSGKSGYDAHGILAALGEQVILTLWTIALHGYAWC